MSKVYDIGVLPGDGIGEEVVNAALVVLDAVQEVFGFKTKREPLQKGSVDTGDVSFPWGVSSLGAPPAGGYSESSLLRYVVAVPSGLASTRVWFLLK